MTAFQRKRAKLRRAAALGYGIEELSALTGFTRERVTLYVPETGDNLPTDERLEQVFDLLLARFAWPSSIRRGFELADLKDAMDCLLQGVGVEHLFDGRRTPDRVRYRRVLIAVAFGWLGVSLNSMARRWGFDHTTLLHHVQAFAEPRGWRADEAGFRKAVGQHGRCVRRHYPEWGADE